MSVHRLSQVEARRIAIRAQLLDAHRPTDLLTVVEHLTFLSPFDRLVHDRVRAQELFGFEYYLEMYKPKQKRRWGYFALPVLHHDRLVGKVALRPTARTQACRCTPSAGRQWPLRAGPELCGAGRAMAATAASPPEPGYPGP